MDNEQYLLGILEKTEVESRARIKELEGLQNTYLAVIGENDPKIEQQIEDNLVQFAEKSISVIEGAIVKLTVENKVEQARFARLQTEYHKMMGQSDPFIFQRAQEKNEQYLSRTQYLSDEVGELQKNLATSASIDNLVEDEPVINVVSSADLVRYEIRRLEAEKSSQIAVLTKVKISCLSEFYMTPEKSNNIELKITAVREEYNIYIKKETDKLTTMVDETTN